MVFVSSRYNTEAGDFDQGVVCMVRGDPNKFDEFRDAVQCDIIDQLEADFSYDENEELVSNIIAVTGTEQFKVIRGIFNIFFFSLVEDVYLYLRPPADGVHFFLLTTEAEFNNLSCCYYSCIYWWATARQDIL